MTTSKNNKENKKTTETSLTVSNAQTKEISDLKEQVMEMKKSEEEATNIILKQDNVISNLREEIMKLHIAFKLHIMQMQDEYNKEVGGLIFDKDMEIMHLNEDVKKFKGELLKVLKGEQSIYKIEDLEEKPARRGASSLPSKSIPKTKKSTPAKPETPTTPTTPTKSSKPSTPVKTTKTTKSTKQEAKVETTPVNKSTKKNTKSEQNTEIVTDNKIEVQAASTSNITIEATEDTKPKAKRGKKAVEKKN
jgi:hypothetical protein